MSKKRGIAAFLCCKMNCRIQVSRFVRKLSCAKNGMCNGKLVFGTVVFRNSIAFAIS